MTGTTSTTEAILTLTVAASTVTVALRIPGQNSAPDASWQIDTQKLDSLRRRLFLCLVPGSERANTWDRDFNTLGDRLLPGAVREPLLQELEDLEQDQWLRLVVQIVPGTNPADQPPGEGAVERQAVRLLESMPWELATIKQGNRTVPVISLRGLSFTRRRWSQAEVESPKGDAAIGIVRDKPEAADPTYEAQKQRFVFVASGAEGFGPVTAAAADLLSAQPGSSSFASATAGWRFCLEGAANANYIRNLASNPLSIAVVVAHGAFTDTGDQVLNLADSTKLPSEELASSVAGSALLVLAACHSADDTTAADGSVTPGAAAVAAIKGIPAVIGFHGRVPIDKVLEPFLKRFLASLLRGEYLDDALWNAREELPTPFHGYPIAWVGEGADTSLLGPAVRRSRTPRRTRSLLTNADQSYEVSPDSYEPVRKTSLNWDAKDHREMDTVALSPDGLITARLSNGCLSIWRIDRHTPEQPTRLYPALRTATLDSQDPPARVLAVNHAFRPTGGTRTVLSSDSATFVLTVNSTGTEHEIECPDTQSSNLAAFLGRERRPLLVDTMGAVHDHWKWLIPERWTLSDLDVAEIGNRLVMAVVLRSTGEVYHRMFDDHSADGAATSGDWKKVEEWTQDGAPTVTIVRTPRRSTEALLVIQDESRLEVRIPPPDE